MSRIQPLGRIFDAIHKVWSYIGEADWENYKKDAGIVKKDDEDGKQNGA